MGRAQAFQNRTRPFREETQSGSAYYVPAFESQIRQANQHTAKVRCLWPNPLLRADLPLSRLLCFIAEVGFLVAFSKSEKTLLVPALSSKRCVSHSGIYYVFFQAA
ncbi:hypothetical protein Ddc_08186 [Ditylenchus destructor]|nr:hypothetical protein Ddc_08186 [Ditylenchus destructor]